MEYIVEVKTGTKDYQVIIGNGIHYGERIAAVRKPCKVVLVSDDIVYGLYGEKTEKELKEYGFDVFSYVFPNGEKSKNLTTAAELYEFCAQKGISGSDLFVALGGGVTGDLTGFVAATYLRGMEFVQLPTTFLAAIDSSVGGKTAVDLKAGKNLVGSFHQPVLVLCDTDTFSTLPKEVFADGMAEAVKYGMIKDKELFETFEKGDFDINRICKRCVEIKAEVVGEDEFDKGLRKILNFGHTVGHAVEKLSNYEIPHGSAVAIGMVIVTRAMESALENKPMTNRLLKVLEQYNLPVSCEYSANDLALQAVSDKKRAGSTISVILPECIGEVKIVPMTMEEWNSYVNKGV